MLQPGYMPVMGFLQDIESGCRWEITEGTGSTARFSLLGPSRHQSIGRCRSPSLSNAMLLILATTALGVSGTWTDFANNLGSDLAPLIALFGEQVTIQYLSESFSILDNLVFALAPIGIITAMVAAIRVAGNAQLRSFIGRATESRGTVEADLMSSTSSDVCELWNGQGVVRVLGSPRLLQLIYFPAKKYDGKAGIYELREAVSSNLYREDVLFHAWNLDDEGNDQPAAHLDHQNPPNLSLNININVESRRRNAKILTFVGVLLQGGVLVSAWLVQYKPTILEENEPTGYGFPLFLSGTVSLAIGMFLCAQVIESSTTEYTYRPSDSSTGPVTTMWVQMGGQMVGDQLFESFARKGRSATVLVSHRSKRNSNFLAIIAVGTSLFGFITQFVGLRALHATITVAQLGVVLLMTALRSFSHMQRIGDNDLKALNHGDEEELNWVARSILGCGSWDVSRSLSPPALSPDPLSAHGQQADMAMDLMITRARLATLTPKWPSRNRINAQNLQRALDNTINYVFGHMTLREDCGGELQWLLPVTTTSTSHVSLLCTRKKDENNRWKPWAAEVDQLEAVICLWASSLRAHRRDGRRIAEIRLLGPTTEHSEPDHKLWISRGTAYQTIPASEIDAARCFGWWEAVRNEQGERGPADTLDVTSATRGGIEKHCMQDVYGWFIRGLMRIVADIGGTTTPRVRDFPHETMGPGFEGWNWLSVQNSSLDQLAVYFVESGLGTLEEAYFCLVPALRSANIMPEAKVLNQRITNQLLHFMEKGEYYHALDVARWCCGHTLNANHQFRALTNMTGLLRDLAPMVSDIAGLEHTPQKWWATISHDWEKIAAPSDDHLHGLLTMCRAYLPPSPDPTPFPGESLADLFRRACAMAQTLDVTRPRIARLVLEVAEFGLKQGFPDEAETLAAFVWRTACYSHAMGKRTNRGWSDDITDQAAELVMAIYREGGESRVDQRVSPEALDRVARRGIIGNRSMFADYIASTPIALLVIGETRTALQWAAENGWTKLVLRLLDNGADVNAEASTNRGRTALQAAAGGGHIDIVEALIAKGADLDARASNRGGRTALQAAAGGGHEAVVKMLLDADAAVNAEPGYHAGRTALQAAAEGGHEDVLMMLLEAGADVNAEACPDNGRTALQAAAGGGHQSVVKSLMHVTLDVNAEGSDVGGRTALQAAAEGGHGGIVELLIAGGADIDAKPCRSGGRTAVQAAAGRGNSHLVYRLRAGGNWNADAGELAGRTAVEAAAEGGHLYMVSFLLGMGAGGTATPTAIQVAAAGGHEKVVLCLIEAGAEAPPAALKCAVAGGHLSVVRLLLARGVEATPEILRDAVEAGHNRIILLLIDTGVGGDLALASAAALGDDIIAGILIHSGANVNTPGDKEQPLSIAVRHGHERVVALLLAAGAQVDRSGSGQRPVIDLALAKGHEGIVEQLVKAGAVPSKPISPPASISSKSPGRANYELEREAGRGKRSKYVKDVD